MRTPLKTLLAAPLLAMSLLGASTWASGNEDIYLDTAPINLKDQASLQRGARIFVNYCLSCHSASFMRYNRMGHDLGISDELVKENLLFAADKVGQIEAGSLENESGSARDDAHRRPLAIRIGDFVRDLRHPKGPFNEGAVGETELVSGHDSDTWKRRQPLKLAELARAFNSAMTSAEHDS